MVGTPIVGSPIGVSPNGVSPIDLHDVDVVLLGRRHQDCGLDQQPGNRIGWGLLGPSLPDMHVTCAR